MNLTIARETGRPFRVKRPTVQLFPKGIERTFRAALLAIIDAIKGDIDELLMPEIGRLSRVSGVRGDGEHQDVEDINAIIKTILGDVTLRLNNKHLRGVEELVRGYFNDTSAFSRRQTFRQIRRMIGIDAFPQEAALQTMLNTFVEENVSLIKSLSGEYVDTVGGIVRRRVRAGDRTALIAEDIRKKFKTTREKAKLIARDQTNKINGSLTRMRQTELGIDEYIWRTSRDERVRSRHLELEGKRFSWNNPPDVGHPGQAIQCRCTAEPVIEGSPPPRENRRAVILQVKQKRAILRRQLEGKTGKRAQRARRLIAR